MSNWRNAKNKKNKFIVECETLQQAETIERNAQKRNEMKYINICSKRPRYGANVFESWNTFDDLGEMWKK